MIAQTHTTMSTPEPRSGLGPLEVMFVLSSFLALLNPSLIRAFTGYDAAVSVLAFLILAGPVRMLWIPPSLRLAGVLLVVAGLASAFRATYPIEAAFQVLIYAFVFLVQLPVILTLGRSRKAVHGALLMVILAYVVIVIFTMFNQVERGGRVLAFHKDENANVLGLPTVFLIPFVLYFALDQWRKRRRVLVLVATGAMFYLMLWALTASASRGSTVATIVSLAVFVPFRHGFALRPKVFLRIAAVVVAVTAVGAFVYWTEIPSPTLARRVESTLGSREEHSVVDERVALDRSGLRAFLESPLVGTGFDNFRYVAQFYDDSATLHAPHNLWIQLLAQTGLVGAVAFLFVIARWFVLLLRTQSIVGIRSQRELLWAFIAAMTGIMVHAIAAPLVLHRHYWLLYGLGVITAIQCAAPSQDEAEAPASDTSRVHA